MYENFLKIDKAKQDRILNAAYEEFAKHGYKQASTLEITKRANISKGILFHYFGNKRNLYFYLYDVGIVYMHEKLHHKQPSNPDFFERMSEMAVAKMEIVITEYPYMYGYFVKVYTEQDEHVFAELQQRLSMLLNDQSILSNDIDMTPFRKDVDIALLCDLLVNFCVSFLQNQLQKYPNGNREDINQIMHDFQPYLDMLKQNFYKEEYL